MAGLDSSTTISVKNYNLPHKYSLFLGGLLALLGLRAVFYHQFGPGLNWVPSLELLNESPHFRSSHFNRALAYSVLSFGRWLVALYFCLALLSTLRPTTKGGSQWSAFLDAQFGWLGHWPTFTHWLAALALAGPGPLTFDWPLPPVRFAQVLRLVAVVEAMARGMGDAGPRAGGSAG